MIIAAASVIAIVAVTVMIACYKAANPYLEMKNHKNRSKKINENLH